MSVGTAKIVTNEGSGVYTITQTFLDISTGLYSTVYFGFENVTATDLVGLEDRSVGDDVQFITQQTVEGTVYPVLTDIRGLPPFPESDNTYFLKLIVTSGVPALSWHETIDECPEPE